MTDLEKPLTKECICQGSGKYRRHSQPEVTAYYRGEATLEEWLPIEVEDLHCSFHWENPGRDIYYPDGWEEEDLRAWCKAQKVPEPAWLKKRRSGLAILNLVTVDWIKSQVDLKPFWENQSSSWDGNQYTTYGKASSASQIEQMSQIAHEHAKAYKMGLAAQMEAKIEEAKWQMLKTLYEKPLYEVLDESGFKPSSLKGIKS